MAEHRRTTTDRNNYGNKAKPPDSVDSSEGKCTEEAGIPECAVCLQACVHPARLPCSHIFCFLCLKGLATQNRRCAMCRQEIPVDYLDHPQLLEYPTQAERDLSEDGYQWFYEGRSGWWQYDERTSCELESAFKSGQRSCELLIAGQLYIADFDAMLQLRCSDMSRRRRIKRDLASIPKKGIAGLRLDGSQVAGSGEDQTVPSAGVLIPSAATDVNQSLSSSDVSEPQLFHPEDNAWRNPRSETRLVDVDDDLEEGVGSEEYRELEYDDDNGEDDDGGDALPIKICLDLHNLYFR